MRPSAGRIVRVPLAVPFWAAGSVLVFVFFLFVDLGGTVSGSVHPVLAAIALVWSGPFFLYGVLVRTRLVAVLGGTALLAATAGFLVALFRDQHSTAGLGLLTIPFWLYLGALVVLVVDRLISSKRMGERP